MELGLYGGVFLPPDDHELYGKTVPFLKLDSVAADVGIRAAYLPLPYLGAEVEFGIIPTSFENDKSAMIFAFRGHILAQYPARFAPFIVAGGGLLGLRSDDDAHGNDTDGVLHWGVGAKFYATRWLALRIDGRHIIGSKFGDGGVAPYFEILGGLSWVIGWDKGQEVKDRDDDGVPDERDKCPDQPASTEDGCPVQDRDGDGVVDGSDKCPDQPARTADGCPADRDGDGVTDDKDQCPDLPARTANGCPGDSDGDGVTDDKDKCPKVAAATPDGCPPPDRDGDGVVDAQDRCPDKPETKNNYQDADGCPDELPQVVKRFTGSIKGITFATGKARIRPASFATLNKAADVLKQYPELRLQVRGHTDNTGSREINLKLSLARAQAVKDYLVGQGIDGGRLTVEGLGPDEPIADNKTRAGRAQNRRIEFKLAGQ